MDMIDIARYFSALVLVLSLLGFAALAARKYGLPGIARGTVKKRLAVVETLMVGPRQKLFLIKRDGVEHLVLMGPQGANVIESGIAPQPDFAHTLSAVSEAAQ
ncbi:MAG: flagellar biosynthetic protein FliO [Rhizomicrobium sp.]|jgi:flagellar protein FliO/FliZ